MSDVLKDVWVMRTPLGHVHVMTEFAFNNGAPLQFGWTVTRETLLTPEMRAIILEAAQDIEYSVNAEYHGPDDVHPAMRAKYTRDMAIVGQLRGIVPDALRAQDEV